MTDVYLIGFSVFGLFVTGWIPRILDGQHLRDLVNTDRNGGGVGEYTALTNYLAAVVLPWVGLPVLPLVLWAIFFTD